MSTNRKPRVSDQKDANEILDAILKFGPENQNTSSDFTDRVKQIIKKLQEISRRIDHLASHL